MSPGATLQPGPAACTSACLKPSLQPASLPRMTERMGWAVWTLREPLHSGSWQNDVIFPCCGWVGGFQPQAVRITGQEETFWSQCLYSGYSPRPSCGDIGDRCGGQPVQRKPVLGPGRVRGTPEQELLLISTLSHLGLS
jgi:hypothetical protein